MRAKVTAQNSALPLKWPKAGNKTHRVNPEGRRQEQIQPRSGMNRLPHRRSRRKRQAEVLQNVYCIRDEVTEKILLDTGTRRWMRKAGPGNEITRGEGTRRQHTQDDEALGEKTPRPLESNSRRIKELSFFLKNRSHHVIYWKHPAETAWAVSHCSSNKAQNPHQDLRLECVRGLASTSLSVSVSASPRRPRLGLKRRLKHSLPSGSSSRSLRKAILGLPKEVSYTQ